MDPQARLAIAQEQLEAVDEAADLSGHAKLRLQEMHAGLSGLRKGLAETGGEAVTDGGIGDYTQRALERGRPDDPCTCGECHCRLHTFDGDHVCVWCRNGQHRDSDAPAFPLFDEGYPYNAIQALVGGAEARFSEKLDEHGTGKHWLEYDPEWFLWDATRNIGEAGGPDDPIERKHLYDAVNYLAFALEAEVEDEGEEPVTDGGTAVVRDDPHTEPLAVTEADGLCLPEALIGYEGGLVARMPNGATIDCKPREWGAHIPSVRPRHFGENASGNDHLEPDEVGLKQYGEAEQVYRVAVDGEEDE